MYIDLQLFQSLKNHCRLGTLSFAEVIATCMKACKATDDDTILRPELYKWLLSTAVKNEFKI